MAVEKGAKRLIVLQTGYACARQSPPSGAIASALHALTLLISRQLTHELESLDQSIDYHVVPPLCPLVGSPYDFSHTEELIERASANTDAWIAAGGVEQRTIPHEMLPHAHGK